LLLLWGSTFSRGGHRPSALTAGRSCCREPAAERMRGAAQVQCCAALRNDPHTLQTTCEVQCVLRRCRREGGVCTLQHPSFSTRMGRRGAGRWGARVCIWRDAAERNVGESESGLLYRDTRGIQRITRPQRWWLTRSGMLARAGFFMRSCNSFLATSIESWSAESHTYLRSN
jgi:hypothetical protein